MVARLSDFRDTLLDLPRGFTGFVARLGRPLDTLRPFDTLRSALVDFFAAVALFLPALEALPLSPKSVRRRDRCAPASILTIVS